MGVKNLWSLLEPAGRRVPIEAIGGKRVAVDASIWLVQFIKAMRDERGDMLPNAHIMGFFRRICRLLYHRISPIFVFDGATPALKRRTTAARRRIRENKQGQVRRTAEKLLLNAMKASVLNQALNKGAGTSASGASGSGEASPDPLPSLPSTQRVPSTSPATTRWKTTPPRRRGAIVLVDDDPEWQDEDWRTRRRRKEEEEDMFIPDGDDIDPEFSRPFLPRCRWR